MNNNEHNDPSLNPAWGPVWWHNWLRGTRFTSMAR